MKKTAFLITLCLVLLPAVCFAQVINALPDELDNDPNQPVLATEAGLFQRSSISFLNVLAQQGTPLRRDWADMLVRIIQNSVHMPRFDYNAISQTVVDNFLAMPNSVSIEDRMNATVVPAILTAVEAESELRAMGMLTEQQRNSFIVNKARELGITETELNAVMNSAYIFVAVFNGMQSRRNESGATVVTLNAGGHWWRIDNSGEKPKAVLFSRIESTRRATHQNPDSAFISAARTIASDVQIATRGIPEFQLTAQIISRTARHVEISIGKNEDVKIDDKFRVFEQREDSEGNVRERRRGWIMADRILKGTEESQSRAQIISGSPYLGAIVREVPELGIDINLAFITTPRSIEVKNSTNPNGGTLRFKDVEISNMFGPRLKVGTNMARFGVPIPQFWVNLSGEYLWGDAKGSVSLSGQEVNLSGTESYGGELSIAKKWYIRRFVIAPEVGFGVKRVLLKTEEIRGTWTLGQGAWLTQFAYSQWSVGAIANLGLEIAITPLVNIGGFAGLSAFTGGNQWSLTWLNKDREWVDYTDFSDRNSGDFRLKNTGVTSGVYASWAIPSRRNKR